MHGGNDISIIMAMGQCWPTKVTGAKAQTTIV